MHTGRGVDKFSTSKPHHSHSCVQAIAPNTSVHAWPHLLEPAEAMVPEAHGVHVSILPLELVAEGHMTHSLPTATQPSRQRTGCATTCRWIIFVVNL